MNNTMLILPVYSKLKLPFMKKSCHLLIALLVVNFFSVAGLAQNVSITGMVRNSISKEPIPSVSILAKGESSGTFTNEDGTFKLTVAKTPVTLIFSSIGFETYEMVVTDAIASVEVELNPVSSLGQEVVISASRLPERILESPVSIERVSAANLSTAHDSSYYDIVSILKDVDVLASSLTFNTPTSRGFAGSGSSRFNQIVDGMDYQAPS